MLPLGKLRSTFFLQHPAEESYFETTYRNYLAGRRARKLIEGPDHFRDRVPKS
jgi:hypothetical protein